MQSKKAVWAQDDRHSLSEKHQKEINGYPESIKELMFKNERKKGEFGPPVFDEYKSVYRWRQFKKGFSWGFILTLPIFYQFGFHQHWMYPTKYTKGQLAGFPLVISVCAGCAFGFYEMILNPQTCY